MLPATTSLPRTCETLLGPEQRATRAAVVLEIDDETPLLTDLDGLRAPLSMLSSLLVVAGEVGS